ncbi:hypothetical protein P5P86_19170 [Nocardioides sp. BP30]|uniref:hypothetical protein n=1 Tax=Nocardioides sp. BP30 TaxID=3036374 RepID=UPI002468FBB3|nr:hypothetical protein [Nocardioides sp. BP30]WGL52058.1 hypothetical protein P5P86_19170 [Nocardioides sp. BP30]
MKKFIAGVATASALSLGALAFAGTAPALADYGPSTPTASVVKSDVTKAISKPGKISKKKAKKLTAEVKAAKKAGVISSAKAKKLLAKIKKDTKK